MLILQLFGLKVDQHQTQRPNSLALSILHRSLIPSHCLAATILFSSSSDWRRFLLHPLLHLAFDYHAPPPPHRSSIGCSLSLTSPLNWETPPILPTFLFSRWTRWYHPHSFHVDAGDGFLSSIPFSSQPIDFDLVASCMASSFVTGATDSSDEWL